MFASTPRSRQLNYWRQEAQKHMDAWKAAIANNNREAALSAKKRYTEAREIIDEIERNLNNECD